VTPRWAYTKETAQEKLMVRLEDTDVRYKTYRVQSDERVAYLLSPNDPLIEDKKSPTWQLDPLNPHRFEYPPRPGARGADLRASVHRHPYLRDLVPPARPPPASNGSTNALRRSTASRCRCWKTLRRQAMSSSCILLLLHAPPTTHLGSRPRFLLNKDIYL
jgi:hypothetical protein